MQIETLIRYATDEEVKVIGRIVQRVLDRPAIVVTVEGRRYVVAEEDEYKFAGVNVSALGLLANLNPFGCQWLRGYGRVDEQYRTFEIGEVTKIERLDRKRVWGR